MPIEDFTAPATLPSRPQDRSVLQSPAAAPAPTQVIPHLVPETPPAALNVEVSALTDIGNVRTNNEDYFGYDSANRIYVVCDGMGGMASGEIASSGAVATLLAAFTASHSCGTIETRLFDAIRAANTVVWEQGQALEHKGMGTTLVALTIEGNRLLIGNVGDSRAYVLQDGACTQLTVDHSYVNELIRAGALTLETAQTADLEGMESVITRAIGAKPTVEPDLFSVELRSGTLVLLATDGLTRYLNAQELAAILGGTPFESTCAELIRIAKRRGGKDNITCLLLRFT
jgi:protein phosphatase